VLRSFALVLALTLPSAVLGAEEDPVPYSDDPPDRQSRPSRSAPATGIPSSDVEDPEQEMYRHDDPYVGLGAELVGGWMLLDSSQGALVESSLGLGIRGVWEFGRSFSDELLRNALFADVMYAFSWHSAGTQITNATSYYHYLSVAPAWMFRFGEGNPFGVYLQLGGGLSIQGSTLRQNGVATSVTGFKPLIQYGGGFRFVPRLSPDGTVRLAFRLELTRFRRGYMDDTLIGLSAGAVF
jgi:hypothetical protein